MAQSLLSYAGAAGGDVGGTVPGRPNFQAAQRPKNGAAIQQPAYHLHQLYGRSILLDWKAAKPGASKDDVIEFILDVVRVPAASICSVTIEHGSQLFLFTMEGEEIYEGVLARLREGIAWPKANGAKVFGWATLEALTQVRVSNVPFYLSLEALKIHLSQYGRVIRTNRGRCRKRLPNAADGVIHLTMQLENPDWLPRYIQLVDEKGVLAASMAVNADEGKRPCYKCGSKAHPSFYCRAGTRPRDAPAAVWSTMIFSPNMLIPLAPAEEPPVVQEGGGPPIEEQRQGLVERLPDQTGEERQDGEEEMENGDSGLMAVLNAVYPLSPAAQAAVERMSQQQRVEAVALVKEVVEATEMSKIPESWEDSQFTIKTPPSAPRKLEPSGASSSSSDEGGDEAEDVSEEESQDMSVSLLAQEEEEERGNEERKKAKKERKSIQSQARRARETDTSQLSTQDFMKTKRSPKLATKSKGGETKKAHSLKRKPSLNNEGAAPRNNVKKHLEEADSERIENSADHGKKA